MNVQQSASELAYRETGQDGFNPSTGRYVCGVCGCDYKWRNSLLRHRHECGRSKMFQCPVCPHQSKRKDNLAKHILFIHHSPKKK